MKFFDHFADASMTPQGAWIVEQTHRAEFRLMRPYLAHDDISLLEIGPGQGGLSRVLAREGFSNYIGVEPNTQMREALADAGFRTKNYLVPPFQEQDESFDWVILINVFEHLNGTPEAAHLVQDAYRILKPQGFLCLAGPDYLHWKQDFFNCDYTHSNIMTVRRSIQLFHNYGFRTVKYEYLSGFMTGFAATALSRLTRAGLFYANGNGIDKKLYKLKLSFLRRFLIIGQRI